MTEDACILDKKQRDVVESTIGKHCRLRGWQLHTVNCRTNHVHVVVTADCPPKQVRAQFKAWCTRRLKKIEASRLGCTTPEAIEEQVRENWWAARGSGRYINDEEGLDGAIQYVRDGQDLPRASDGKY